MAKSKLGRGLNSLFTEPIRQEPDAESVTTLRITQIEPNREQPRQTFDKEKTEALADSIKEHGVIQPIIVVKKGDRYKIVAGERRWRAAKMAGLKEIPVVIRDYTELEVAQIALIENLQREDLNPIEEALGYRTLMNKFDMTQEAVSNTIGKSRSAIANSIRLLSLEDNIRSKLISGEITSGHARALLSVGSPELRSSLLDAIIEKDLNVRQAEALAKQLGSEKPKKEREPVNEQLRAALDLAECQLSSYLGTKVSLIHTNKKGKIEIEYFGNDDLDRIIKLISDKETV